MFIPFVSIIASFGTGIEVVFIQEFRTLLFNDGCACLQIGSHYHFIETNPYLIFDREKAYGMRLNILAGTAVRFEVTVDICFASEFTMCITSVKTL